MLTGSFWRQSRGRKVCAPFLAFLPSSLRMAAVLPRVHPGAQGVMERAEDPVLQPHWFHQLGRAEHLPFPVRGQRDGTKV